MGLQCGEKGASSKQQMGKLTMVGREACLLQLCPPTPLELQGMRPQVSPTQVIPGPNRPVRAPSAQTQASLSAADPELPHQPHYPHRAMNGKCRACLAWGERPQQSGTFPGWASKPFHSALSAPTREQQCALSSEAHCSGQKRNRVRQMAGETEAACCGQTNYLSNYDLPLNHMIFLQSCGQLKPGCLCGLCKWAAAQQNKIGD